jgi:transcriptional regulator with XRE-family HTH domain
MKLAELIRSRREAQDMSLQDLADACGLTKSHVWEIEQGKTVNIGLLSAVRLSIALNVGISVLAAAALETLEPAKCAK